ncbi:MAG TPA: hypothetical protein VIT68_05415 [Candidatus Gracilibacteria bacterium]
MIKVMHRINTVEALQKIPHEYGVEIDIRAHENGERKLILNHEPFEGGEDFEDFLKAYQHAFIILNIKEAGIESEVLSLCAKYGVKDYFLLDVEFPYIYRSSRVGNRSIAIRYSEDEPIEQALKYKDKVDWVWIDTNTQLPLDPEIIEQLKGFKTALVCPERWGRPEDIPVYIEQMKSLNFKPDLVMTAAKFVDQWNF